MAKKIKLMAILMMLSFFGVHYASAQATDPGGSSTATLATVNIYRAKVVAQKDNNLTIDFDISNRVGIQPGVRYSVVLMGGEAKNQTIIDEKVYGETLVLGPNSTVHKEITYTAPGYLKGDFDVWVRSANDRGLPLGQGVAGKITLNGNGQWADIIPASCSLKIDGEVNKKYTLDQGVDVAPTENLILVCDVQNNFSSAITVTPNFNTFYRITFGDPVASAKQSSLSLAPGQKETLEFPIPKVAKPQAYDATLSLLDDKGMEISNEITAHYVLEGDSATIQNLSLDKNSYAQGDTANVTFSWTARADWFNGSRELKSNPPTATPANDVVNLTITSGGSACSDAFKQELDYGNMINVGLKVPIKANCPNPKVSFVLEDKNGNALDKEEFNLNNNPSSNNKAPSQPAAANNNSMKKIVLTLVAILLIISLVLIAVYRKRRNNLVVFLALIIFSGAFFSLGAHPAKADTFVSYSGCALQEKVCTGGFAPTCKVQNDGWTNGVYSVNLDNTAYAPGAGMVVSGWTNGVAACSNGATVWGVGGAYSRVIPTPSNMATLQGNDFALFATGMGAAKSGALARAAESTPGNYYVSFVGQTWNPMKGGTPFTQGTQNCGSTGTSGWDYRDHYEIGYTVNNACSLTPCSTPDKICQGQTCTDCTGIVYGTKNCNNPVCSLTPCSSPDQICQGQTCTDCSGTVNGTKNCNNSCSLTPCSSPDQICQGQFCTDCTGTVNGTKQCDWKEIAPQ